MSVAAGGSEQVDPGRPLPPLADARWPEVDAAERAVLVVPAGALEQHGPHLPLDTDARIAEAVSAHVHAARPDAGLVPVLALGASGEHADFPGTLSIGAAAFTTLVVELVRDATRQWGAVLVLNGHGGNAVALRDAATVCAEEGRLLRVHHLGAPGMDAHAGRAETSMMLALDPHRVRMDLVEPGVTEPIGDLLPRLRTSGVRAVSESGVLGDPRGAKADEGAAMLDGLAAAALAAYDDLVAQVRAGRVVR